MKRINIGIVGNNIKLVNTISIVLKEFEDIVLSDFFANIEDFYAYEEEMNIDILFWDLDEEDGYLEKQIEKINSDKKQMKLIYISSKPEDVLNAFKFGAVDFIQKPVSKDHLFGYIKRYKLLLCGDLVGVEKKGGDDGAVRFIIVPSLKDVMIIKVDSIVYMKSEGRYTLIYKQDGEVVVSSKNLGFYEELLKKSNFFRIHHSFLVNINLSLKIQKKGGLYLQIVNGKHLPISKRRADSFYSYLKTIA